MGFGGCVRTTCSDIFGREEGKSTAPSWLGFKNTLEHIGTTEWNTVILMKLLLLCFIMLPCHSNIGPSPLKFQFISSTGCFLLLHLTNLLSLASLSNHQITYPLKYSIVFVIHGYNPSLLTNSNHNLVPCVFIGYSTTNHAYICLDLSTNKIFTSRHVILWKTSLPFITKLPITSLLTSFRL